MKKKILTLLTITILSSFMVVSCQKGSGVEVAGTETANEQVAAKSSNNKEVITWKFQTIWSPAISLIDADLYMAEKINELSNGRLIIEINPADSIATTKEVFDAVRKGTLDAASDYPGYWSGKGMPALDFYYSFAGGMNAMDTYLWYYNAGGEKYIQEIYGKHGIVPLMNSATGMESGFRSNKPIRTVEDFKGLKVRMGTRPGQYVLQKMGAKPVSMAGGELYTALDRGIIDAAEFSVPSIDWKMGFQEVTKYQCLPGWYQAMYGGGWMINEDSWNKLDDDLKELVKIAARDAYFWSYGKSSWDSIPAAKNFKEHGTTTTSLDKETVKLIDEYVAEYVEMWSEKDPMFKKVAQSYYGYYNDYKIIRDVEQEHGFGFGRTPSVIPNIFN